MRNNRQPTSLTDEQRTYLDAMTPDNLPLWSSAQQWRRQHLFMAAYRQKLRDIESAWQAEMLDLFPADAEMVREYQQLLAEQPDDRGIWPRLRYLKRALRRGRLDRERERKRAETPLTWEQAQQQVFRETCGLLSL